MWQCRLNALSCDITLSVEACHREPRAQTNARNGRFAVMSVLYSCSLICKKEACSHQTFCKVVGFPNKFDASLRKEL